MEISREKIDYVFNEIDNRINLAELFCDMDYINSVDGMLLALSIIGILTDDQWQEYRDRSLKLRYNIYKEIEHGRNNINN